MCYPVAHSVNLINLLQCTWRPRHLESAGWPAEGHAGGFADLHWGACGVQGTGGSRIVVESYSNMVFTHLLLCTRWPRWAKNNPHYALTIELVPECSVVVCCLCYFVFIARFNY